MLKLQDLPPEEMNEVVRRAGEMYDRESTENRERKATVDAAEEMGIPAEYMERAAAVVHAERVEKIQTKRRNRNRALAAGAGALVAVGVASMMVGVRPVPSNTTVVTATSVSAPPLVFDFNTPSAQGQWTLDRNPGTDASLSFVSEPQLGNVARISVRQFGTQNGVPHRADFETLSVPSSLSGYRNVRFHVSGSGLQQVRLYLEKSDTERWRSPAVTIARDWTPVSLSLDSFDYQTRRSPSGSWQRASYRAPDTARRISFKFGDFMNPASARGEVSIDELVFE